MCKHPIRSGLFLFAFLTILIFQTNAFSSIIRVKPDGNDANSGADWTQAKQTVSAAITAAVQGDQIWVAAGTYQENIENKVVSELAVDVALYGGFAGTETALEQRDFSVNMTILDGTQSGAVVRITNNAGPDTRVDGFYIANGTAGISLLGVAPVITNNVIMTNTGPGIYCVNYQILGVSPPVVAFPVITYNTIVNNTAGNGAGIAVVGTQDINFMPTSAPTIAHNIIVRNTAGQNGGGIGSWGHASPVIAYNYIAANTAAKFETGWDSDASVGSWIVGGGGIFATKNDMGGQPIQFAIAAPVIINNMIVANGAWLGGGISLVAYPYEEGVPPGMNPPPIVTNNTVVANNGAGIFWESSFPTIRNNLVAFNTWGFEQSTVSTSFPTIGFNDVYGNMVKGVPSNYKGLTDQTGTNGNISVDPKMGNYPIGELHLQPDSPCIDAGTTAAVEVDWTDFDGQTRSIGAGVDIGADESDGTSWDVAAAVIHVRTDGNDTNDGLTWETAKQTLAAGIFAAASVGGEVWAAAGTYTEHITIPAFVYVYGGFAGNETNRSQRSVSAHETIIDGGGIPTVVLSINAGYLVSALDGFTVKNGGVFTNGAYPGPFDGYEGRGAGIRSAVSSPYIYNNTIKENSLGNPHDNANKRANGAGIHGYLTYSIIAGNTVAQNEVLNIIDGVGGGMYFKLSMPTILGNSITQNHAAHGSAIYCTLSSPKIARNFIFNNAMYNALPPLYMGAETGAITLEMGDGFLIEANLIYANVAGVGAGIYAATNLSGRIENNVIAYNTAYDQTAFGGMGGGIYALAPLIATESLFIVNNTIVGNVGTVYLGEEGGGIAVSIPPQIAGPEPIPDRIVIGNNIIAFNSSGIFETLTNPMIPPTLVQNNFYNIGDNYIEVPPGATDINVDPLFVDKDGGDLRLSPESPCIDAGSNSLAPTSTFIDYWGNPRIFDGDRDGDAIVDMGAHELYLRQPGRGDFDGDRKSDIAVWRAEIGFWYTLSSASPGTYTSTPWGLPTDVPVAGDYDGDGKTDMAVWRPETGFWYLLSSNTPGSYTAIQWGLETDRALPGDYDGDGKTDIAVWRPVTGVWYIIPSNNPGTYISTPWGVDSDRPAPADYDGDGKTDIAVYRPVTGVWYILPTDSSGTYIDTAWGLADDKPAPADYDGDGRTDITVYRPGTGAWYLLPSNSLGTYVETFWGTGSDIPVPSDYDGDNQADIAVWRPGSGTWYVLPSDSPGTYTETWWGMSGDLPISPITRILD
jgi:parallel beta-helix repeat protein